MYDLTKDAANAIPFVMVDTAGTEVTGLGAVFTVTVSKNGAGFGASAGTKAEIAGGWYLYTATAGECDTAGPLALTITGAGCVQQNLVYRVQSATPAVNVTYQAGVAVNSQSNERDQIAAGVWAHQIVPGNDASGYLTASVDLMDGIIEGGGELPYRLTAASLAAVIGADGDTLESLSDQLDAIDPLTAQETADAVWDEAISGHLTAGTTGKALAGGAAGSGALTVTVTVNDEDGDPLDGVECWITTDSAGANVVAGTLSMDAMGVVTFMLDAGTYYLWRQKAPYNFTNPTTMVVA